MKQTPVIQECGPMQSFKYFNEYIGQVYESLSSFSLEELKKPDEYTFEKRLDIDSEAKYSSHKEILKMCRKLETIEIYYARAEEEFSKMLYELLDTKEKNINKYGNLIQSFRFVKRSTTALSLFSASVELMFGLATFTRKLVDVELDSKIPLITLGVVSGLSIVGSILALTYTKQTSDDIFREFKKEKSLLRELEVIFRKGNWIDKELEEVLPFKIDLKLIENIDFKKFTDEKSLKESVFSVIVMSYFGRDKTVIKDEKFLTLVKTFVETPAAQMWLNRRQLLMSWQLWTLLFVAGFDWFQQQAANFYDCGIQKLVPRLNKCLFNGSNYVERMRLRKLLNTMTKSLEDLLKKKSIAGDEVFLNHAALNLYPIFLPLFYESGYVGRARIFFGSIAALSAVQTLRNSDEEEFKGMKNIYLTLLKDYKYGRKMSNDLVDEYD